MEISIIILITCFVIIITVIMIYILIIVVIWNWNQFPVQQQQTLQLTNNNNQNQLPYQTGDIIMRRIFRFEFATCRLYHFGIIADDVNQIYHRTLHRFDKTSISKFFGKAKEYYVLHIPEEFKRPWNESRELLEKQVQHESRPEFKGFLKDFNLGKYITRLND